MKWEERAGELDDRLLETELEESIGQYHKI